jgi:ribonuclease D
MFHSSNQHLEWFLVDKDLEPAYLYSTEKKMVKMGQNMVLQLDMLVYQQLQ